MVTFWLFLSALSLHINYTERGKSWGLTSGKEKCYWPVKSLLLAWAWGAAWFSILYAIFWRAIFWQVWGEPIYCLSFPPSSAVPLKRNWPFWKTCLQLHPPCYSKCKADQTLPTNKDKCTMYSITAKQWKWDAKKYLPVYPIITNVMYFLHRGVSGGYQRFWPPAFLFDSRQMLAINASCCF